jgi:2-polyprenyl-6-methoxyphenol hydroxylase-like FAD-dependent oxidoreductase
MSGSQDSDVVLRETGDLDRAIRRPLSVLVVGGGPAGLYAAQLLKRSAPQRTVQVLERNAPDATTGWGIVFSASTLDWLRAADPATADTLERHLVHWDTLEVRLRGKAVHATGHSFWGIGRSKLLQILRSGCEQVGVDLHFNRQWDDIAAFGCHDLIVAADGLRSKVRDERRDVFGPEFTRSRTKYIWLGTPRMFDRFVFTFHESPYGPLWAYAYRFDNHFSTFNVECHEDTWRRAGLDGATEEESVAFCERIFAEDLSGSPLLSNQSSWVSFHTVRSRAWWDRNVVLVGDAAHTTHFTVGSGTKLAMEDSAALAAAVNHHRDIPSALAQYQDTRMPWAQRMQAAAFESLSWFESLKPRMSLPHEQFAASLLTRNGKMTFEHLRKRDAEFTRRAVGAFAGSARAGAADDRPPLAVPFSLRSVRLAGRVVGRASRMEVSSPSWSGTGPLGRASLVIIDDIRAATPAESMRTWRQLAALPRSHDLHFAVQFRGGRGYSFEPVAEAAAEAGIEAIEWVADCPAALDQLAVIRALWPASWPILARVPIDQCGEREAIKIAHGLIGMGCDALVIPLSRRFGEGTRHRSLSEAVRIVATLPTLVIGPATADEANTLLLAGQADLCMPIARCG